MTNKLEKLEQIAQQLHDFSNSLPSPDTCAVGVLVVEALVEALTNIHGCLEQIDKRLKRLEKDLNA